MNASVDKTMFYTRCDAKRQHTVCTHEKIVSKKQTMIDSVHTVKGRQEAEEAESWLHQILVNKLTPKVANFNRKLLRVFCLLVRKCRVRSSSLSMSHKEQCDSTLALRWEWTACRHAHGSVQFGTQLCQVICKSSPSDLTWLLNGLVHFLQHGYCFGMQKVQV